MAAAICSIVLGLGFGIPGILGMLHFARTGEVWTFMGFPTYGGGPFESIGLSTSVPLLIGFVLVCVAEYPVPKVPSVATVPAGTWLYATSALEPSPDNIQVDPRRDMPHLGQPASAVRIVEYVDAAGVHQGRSMFAKATEVTTIRPAPDPTPFSQAQLDAAEKTAAAAVKVAADRAAAAYGA